MSMEQQTIYKLLSYDLKKKQCKKRKENVESKCVNVITP